MQATATTLVTLGGLMLSLACAVLLEELFLGGLFRFFFAPRKRWKGEASQAAENSAEARFVSGHEFTRADRHLF